MYLFPNPELNLFLYPFVVAGYAYKEYETNISIGVKKLAWLAVPVWVLLLFFFEERDYIYTSGITLWTSEYGALPQLGIDIFRYVIGMAGSVTAILIMQTIGKKQEVLAVLGRYSLQIYIMQCFEMKLFVMAFQQMIHYLGYNPLATSLYLFDLVITPVMAIVTIAVLIGVASLIKKIGWLNRICFGK